MNTERGFQLLARGYYFRSAHNHASHKAKTAFEIYENGPEVTVSTVPGYQVHMRILLSARRIRTANAPKFESKVFTDRVHVPLYEIGTIKRPTSGG